MARVLRWGRSAYETDASLARERADACALGHDWALATEPAPCDALVVTSGVRVTGAVLDGTGARLVVTTTSGYDHVDLAAAEARGVPVLRCPEARRDAVVEHALGELIVLLRRQPELTGASCAGRWARGDVPALAPLALGEATVAVVGLGVIGRRMASVLGFLGARVIGVDPLGGPPGLEVRELDAALLVADAVTLHCSLTPSSRALLDARRLALLPPHGVVVNTARGDVLDLEAAVGAVRRGRLGGLSVDVFPVEPYHRLSDAGGAIRFTPHTAGCGRDLGERVADGVKSALAAWTAGGPLPHRVV